MSDLSPSSDAGRISSKTQQKDPVRLRSESDKSRTTNEFAAPTVPAPDLLRKGRVRPRVRVRTPEGHAETFAYKKTAALGFEKTTHHTILERERTATSDFGGHEEGRRCHRNPEIIGGSLPLFPRLPMAILSSLFLSSLIMSE